MKKVFLLLALASLLQGCKSTPKAVKQTITPIGTWALKTENEDSDFCRFELLADGNARSINLITICYEQWRLLGNDTLVLMGRSMIDGNEQHFADSMKVLKLTAHKMELLEQEYRWEMVRMPD